MFTVKVYEFDYHTAELYECEGVRRQALSNGDTEVAIQCRIEDVQSWKFIRLRDDSPLSQERRAKWPAGRDDTSWNFKNRAIVENANGKTTEIIEPSIAAEELGPETYGNPTPAPTKAKAA